MGQKINEKMNVFWELITWPGGSDTTNSNTPVIPLLHFHTPLPWSHFGPCNYSSLSGLWSLWCWYPTFWLQLPILLPILFPHFNQTCSSAFSSPRDSWCFLILSHVCCDQWPFLAETAIPQPPVEGNEPAWSLDQGKHVTLELALRWLAVGPQSNLTQSFAQKRQWQLVKPCWNSLSFTSKLLFQLVLFCTDWSSLPLLLAPLPACNPYISESPAFLP